jgi:hypothetical protein
VLAADRLVRLTMNGRFSYFAAKRPITSTKMDIGNIHGLGTGFWGVFEVHASRRAIEFGVAEPVPTKPDELETRQLV